MAQYLPTNVNVTNADATVVVVGVDATSEIGVGNLFGVNGTGIISYEVGSVVYSGGNTNVELTTPYAGTTQSGVTGVFIRDFTANYNLPYPNRGDLEVAKLVARAINILDTEVGNLTNSLDGGTF